METLERPFPKRKRLAEPGAAPADMRVRWSTASGAGRGGGVYVDHTAVTTTLLRVDLEDNHGASGGGLFVDRGTVNVHDSNIGWNSSAGGGGGIYARGDFEGSVFDSVSVSISGSTIHHNVGSSATGDGGGLYALGSLTSATVRSSTLSGNRSSRFGGGVYGSGANVLLNNVTVAKNHAANSGGGVHFGGGSLSLRNTMLADNTATSSGPDCGAFFSLDYNLIENISGCVVASTTTNNVTGIDPTLAPLAYYAGGLTRTQPPLPGSAAVNAANPAAPGSGGNACEATDQQGTTRPVGVACDIGAYETDGSEAVPSPPPGAHFVVTSFLDPAGFPGSTEASLGNGICANTAGECTLRAAIEESNALAGAQVIFLPRGHYEDGQGVAGDDAARWGDLDVASGSTITIVGEDPQETVVVGDHGDKVFHVLPGGVLHFESVMARRGSDNLGGGVLNQGTLTLTDAILRDNGGNSGSGVYTTGPLTVTSSSIRDNRAAFNGGGGIATSTASALSIDTSELVDNVAASLGRGGGVSVSGLGAVTITDSTISGNLALDGGGVAAFYQLGSTAVEISSSTISGNVANYTSTDGRGGGVWSSGRLVALTNTTVSGNSAALDGGGFYSQAFNDPALEATNVTFADNVVTVSGSPFGQAVVVPSGTATFANTIVAGSVGPLCGAGTLGIFSSSGHNLSEDSSCNFVDADDQENTDPLLGPLADNGGPTLTRALLDGSPAIDAGDDASAPATDQRGVARPQGPQSDIGAYEVLEVVLEADLSVLKDDGVAAAVPGNPLTWTIEVANAGPDDVVGAVVVDDFDHARLDVGGITWTCAPDAGAGSGTTCPASGDGAALEAGVTVDLEAGDSVTFTVDADVLPGATGTLDNTASVSADGVDDPDPLDDSSTDSDALTPEADLGIAKDNGEDTVAAGGNTVYTITASNVGPSTAPGALVSDAFPDELTCSWTCTPAGGATCTSEPVEGDLLDSVELPPGSSAIYTATCDVDAGVSGTIDNTASIAAPAGVTDSNAANDSATDEDDIEAGAPPDDLTLEDETMESEVTVTAVHTVTLGPNLALVAPAELTVIAGESVVMVEPFSVGVGASLRIQIDPSLLPP